MAEGGLRQELGTLLGSDEWAFRELGWGGGGCGGGWGGGGRIRGGMTSCAKCGATLRCPGKGGATRYRGSAGDDRCGCASAAMLSKFITAVIASQPTTRLGTST